MMKYGDFSGLVQLGVGLHLGTALLQLYGEIGVQPLRRSIARIKSLINEDSHGPLSEELSLIESDYEIFRIKLFNEYKVRFYINTTVTSLLIVVLIFISFNTDDAIRPEVGVILVAVSLLPAIVTLASLWIDAARELAPLKRRADDVERKALKQGR